MLWLGALWHLLGADVGPAGLLLSAATCAILLLAATVAVRALLVRTPQRGVPAVATADARPLVVPRHRDPDAAGRSRPRAPAGVPTAA
jgi:hypothetical protein